MIGLRPLFIAKASLVGGVMAASSIGLVYALVLATAASPPTVTIQKTSSRLEVQDARAVRFRDEKHAFVLEGVPGRVSYLDLETGAKEPLTVPRELDGVEALDATPDMLVLADAAGHIAAKPGVGKWSFLHVEGRVHGLELDPSGKWLLVTATATIAVLDLEAHDRKQRPVQEWTVPDERIAFGPCSGLMALWLSPRSPEMGAILDAATGTRSRGEGVRPTALAVAPDAERLAVGWSDGIIEVTEPAHDGMWSFDGQRGAVEHLHFATPTQLVSATEDGAVRVWDVESYHDRVLSQQQEGVMDLEVSPERRTVLVARRGHATLELIELRDFELRSAGVR